MARAATLPVVEESSRDAFAASFRRPPAAERDGMNTIIVGRAPNKTSKEGGAIVIVDVATPEDERRGEGRWAEFKEASRLVVVRFRPMGLEMRSSWAVRRDFEGADP